jgi:hypothetical protein
MTTRNEKTGKTIPIRRSTRPGTFQPGAAAAAAARRSHERRRGPQGAPQGEPQNGPHGTPQDPVETVGADRIAERLGIAADDFGEAARVVGLERAAQAWPPAARIELARLAPAWCAGYLERVTPNQIQAFGDIKQYLAATWGGGLYAVRILDGNKPAFLADQVQIAGPSKWQGAEVSPPTVPIVMPSAAPAVSAIGDDIRQTLDRLTEAIEGLQTNPDPPAPAAAAAASASPSAGAEGLAGELERWAATSERISQAIRSHSQRVNPEPDQDGGDDDDDDDDERDNPDRPRGIGAVAEEYFTRWLHAAIPLPGGQTHKAPGEARKPGTAAAAPEQGKGPAPPPPPIPAERIL